MDLKAISFPANNCEAVLRNIASDLLRRLSASTLRELDHSEPEAWVKESYEIAVKIAYEDGSLRSTRKADRKSVV